MPPEIREIQTGKCGSRLANGVLFGAVLVAVVVVPLAFSGVTPGSGEVKAPLLALCVTIGLAAWMANGAAMGELSWPRTAAALPLLVFLGLSAISLAYSPHSHASIAELWRLGILAGFFFLGGQVARDHRRMLWLARVIAGTAGLVALYGIAQRFGLDLISWGGSAATGRSFSTCGHPNFLAAYLVGTLPVTGALFLASRDRKTLALWGADVALQALCLYFTFSRGGWLGGLGAAGAFVLVIGWRDRFRGTFTPRARRGWALAGIVTAAIALGAIAGSSYSPFRSKAASLSIQTRVEIYRGGLRMFAAKPVLGHGTGTFEVVFPRFRPREYREIDPRPRVMHAHSEYLEILDELGVVGLGVFGWFLFMVARSGFRAVNVDERRHGKLLMAGFFASATGLLVHGAFCVVLGTSVPAMHLWLALGLLAGSAGGGEVRRLTFGRGVGVGVAAAATAGLALLLCGMSFRPFLSNVREQQGSILKWRGEWGQAIEHYSRAVEMDPHNLEARYEMAVCLAELERHDEAIGAYGDIARISPDYVHVHYNKGMLHAFRHEWDEAEAEFRRADATGALPLGFDLAPALDVLNSDLGNDKKELALFEMIVKARFHEEARLRGVEMEAIYSDIAAKGTEYYLAGRLGRAKAIFKLALSLKPDDRAVLNNLAGVHFQRREYDAAIALCEAFLERNPGDVHVATNLAKAWFVKGETSKARRILEGILAARPGHPEAAELLKKIARP